MAQIKVGLIRNKTSFWDPNTRAYITLSNPVQVITFDENRPDIAKHLERICHACFASDPSLRLYEGTIPQVAVDAWKAKYDLSGLNIAKKRADRLVAESAPMTSASKEKAVEVELKAESVEEKAEEVTKEKEEVVEEKPKKTSTRTRKATAEKK